MAIEVNVRKLTAWRNDLPDQLRIEKLNEVAEDFADEIRHALGKLKCPDHPEHISIITVIADRWRSLRIEQQFCCKDFERKVVQKIGR